MIEVVKWAVITVLFVVVFYIAVRLAGRAWFKSKQEIQGE